MYVVVSVLTLLLVVGALVDIIIRQDGQVKHLPKVVWILLVIFLPLIGSILWFIIGREYSASTGDTFRVRTVRERHPEQSRVDAHPQRAESTEEQLLRVEREIEFHEKQNRIRRLEADLDKRRSQVD